MTLVECVGGCQGKRVGGKKLLLSMHKLIDPVLNVPEILLSCQLLQEMCWHTSRTSRGTLVLLKLF